MPGPVIIGPPQAKGQSQYQEIGASTRVARQAACVAVAPIALTGKPLIDGYQTAVGDNVLVTDQADATTNGLYTVGYSGAWVRATGFENNSFFFGLTIAVMNGTVNANSIWVLQSPTTGTIVGTSSQTWVAISGGGGGGGAPVQVVQSTMVANGTVAINTIQPVNSNPKLRFIVDGALTSGSPTITSASANFTAADIGKNISNWAQPTSVNGGIPAGTTIIAVGSTTSATMSQNATASLPNTTVQIGDVLTALLAGGAATSSTLTVKNVSQTLGFVVLPTGGDTVNGSTVQYIVSPQTTVTFVRDTSTNWTPLGARIPGGLVTFPRNSFGYVGSSWGLQWGGGAWANFGWLTNGLIRLGHRLVMTTGAYNALSGSGVTDAGYLARLALVLVANPGSVILEIGPNDVGADNQPANTIIAAITAAMLMCSTSGRNAIVTTVPPNSTYTTAQQLVQGTVNAWIREQQAQDGVTVIDIAAALTDPANSTPAQWITGYTTDGVHPIPAGSSACAPVIYNALVDQFSPTNLPSQSDSTQIFPYGSATWANEPGRSGAGFNRANQGDNFGFAYYWSTGPTNEPTYSNPKRTDGIPGTWQQIILAAGDGGILQQSDYTGNLGQGIIVPGKAYRAYLEFTVSGVETTPTANKQQMNMSVIGFDNSFNAVINTGDNYNFGLTSDQIPQPFGIFFTEPFVIPPTCTSLFWSITLNGGATYQFGRVGIIPVV